MDFLNELSNYIREIVTNPTVLFLGTSIAIDIAPIKIDPWKWLFKKIGQAINGEMLKEIAHIKEDIATIKKDQEEDNAENMRARILSFARSCRKHEQHDAEEWNNIISQLRKYEAYVDDRDIENGVIEENAAYLRELYHKRLVNNDFE